MYVRVLCGHSSVASLRHDTPIRCHLSHDFSFHCSTERKQTQHIASCVHAVQQQRIASQAARKNNGASATSIPSRAGHSETVEVGPTCDPSTQHQFMIVFLYCQLHPYTAIPYTIHPLRATNTLLCTHAGSIRSVIASCGYALVSRTRTPTHTHTHTHTRTHT